MNGFYHGIFGYSDDNMLLAPSEYALQKMLEICENFASSHNLKFSTDVNPAKCKTKCIAFTKKPRQLKDMKLCGDNLPWVSQFKHLGNNISNQGCFTSQDIVIKRAICATKNMELNNEFYFADPQTKFKINQIYNSHYTGSPLWNLFGAEAVQFESTYNKSVKIMYDVPLATHRHLIEPITNQRHVRLTLVSRFLGFIDQIKTSQKIIQKMLLGLIKHDVRSTTGLNLRKILLQTEKLDVDSLCKDDCSSLSYHPTPLEDKWKEAMVNELIEVRGNQIQVEGFETEELETILEHLCVG